ncbi:glycosyltransferase family 8 protein [Cereibacter changlensis]|nr:glycosyltransferase [Cereibacter changlensis]
MANAIYLVVDENLSDIAGLQAERVARQWECDVHIFVERRDLSAEVRQFQADGRIFYHFEELGRFLPAGLPEDNKWPKIVYLRIFAPQVLSGYKRLLYIDADVLSMWANPVIWELSLPSGLGAVCDLATLKRPPADEKRLTREEWLSDIGVKSGRYFNSGVLLIDPQKWLTIDFTKKLAEYFRLHPNAVRFDQDFLAHVFDGTWTELSPRFNYQAHTLECGMTEAVNPVFIHFSRTYKPWYGRSTGWSAPTDPRFYDLYREMIIEAGLRPESYHRPARVNMIRQAKYALRAWLTQMGIKSRRETREIELWKKRGDQFREFMDAGLSSGRFSDETRTKLSAEQYPPVFDGRFAVGSDNRPR